MYDYRAKANCIEIFNTTGGVVPKALSGIYTTKKEAQLAVAQFELFIESKKTYNKAKKGAKKDGGKQRTT